MADILLSTLNARYIHPAFGLRWLMANLGELQPRAALQEFTLEHSPVDAAEALLAQDPRIIGLGVYVWNARKMTHLVKVIKSVAPQVTVVVGGPEVSHELEGQEITARADVVITGEAEQAFRQVCRAALAGEPLPEVVVGGAADLDTLTLPYGLYDADDIAHRTLYVETSRGCPYECAFCLSALDRSVRRFPVEPVLAELRELLRRGATHLKFVDRALHLGHASEVLELLLEPRPQAVMAHFELVPDRLPPRLRPLLARFAPGTLQLEAGVQTFNPEVAARICRRADTDRLADTLAFLARTHAHVHADLVVGLPGETLDSFGAGFDRLWHLGPQEVQVGLLKRLRGAPINDLVDEHGLVFDSAPPYEILQTDALDFATVRRLKRFSQAWDRVVNSGHFRDSARRLWTEHRPFVAFLRFADWLYGRVGRTHSIALKRLADLLFEYLTAELRQPSAEVGPALLADYRRGGRRDRPSSLQPFPEPLPEPPPEAPLPRQARHLGRRPRHTP